MAGRPGRGARAAGWRRRGWAEGRGPGIAGGGSGGGCYPACAMPSRARRLRQLKANKRKALEAQGRPSAAPPGTERLQRVLADAGVASRRECERLIEAGHVSVNGRVVTTLPVFVDKKRDRIAVEGRPLATIAPAATKAELVYVLHHKPSRVLCSMGDRAARAEGNVDLGRKTVADLVQHPSGVRLYPASGLDFHATGLVLMTNDGALAERLAKSRKPMARVYQAVLRGHLSNAQVAEFAPLLVPGLGELSPEEVAELDVPLHLRGMRDGDGAGRGGRPGKGGAGKRERERAQHEDAAEMGWRIRITKRTSGASRDASAERQRELGGARTVIEFVLPDVPRVAIEDTLARVNVRCKSVSLVGLGPLRLANLPIGAWRELERGEVQALRRALPEPAAPAVAAAAGEAGGPAERTRVGGKRPPTAAGAGGRAAAGLTNAEVVDAEGGDEAVEAAPAEVPIEVPVDRPVGGVLPPVTPKEAQTTHRGRPRTLRPSF